MVSSTVFNLLGVLFKKLSIIVLFFFFFFFSFDDPILFIAARHLEESWNLCKLWNHVFSFWK